MKSKRIPENGPCCICGLTYERVGNNPHPLAMKGRCCDACAEVVTEARLGELTMADVERVRDAMARKLAEIGDLGVARLGEVAIAAICAYRGPGLLAEKKRQFAELQRLMEAEAAKQ